MQLIAHDQRTVDSAFLPMDSYLASFQIDLRPGHSGDLTVPSACMEQPDQQVRVVLPGLVRPGALAWILGPWIDRREQRGFLFGRQIPQSGFLRVHARQLYGRRPLLFFSEPNYRVPIAYGHAERIV
jgi:hypothetical protein